MKLFKKKSQHSDRPEPPKNKVAKVLKKISSTFLNIVPTSSSPSCQDYGEKTCKNSKKSSSKFNLFKRRRKCTTPCSTSSLGFKKYSRSNIRNENDKNSFSVTETVTEQEFKNVSSQADYPAQTLNTVDSPLTLDQNVSSNAIKLSDDRENSEKEDQHKLPLGFSCQDFWNKKVSQPQNYIDSNFENEGCDDSEILHGEKEKYNTTTVNEHVEEGKPVVLVGYITENDGTTKTNKALAMNLTHLALGDLPKKITDGLRNSKKMLLYFCVIHLRNVVILAAARQKIVPKANPICNSGDSVAALPGNLIPTHDDLYPEKLTTPLQRLFDGDLPNSKTESRLKKLKKQAYKAFSRISKSAKSSSETSVKNDSAVESPEMVFSADDGASEETHNLHNNAKELVATVSSSRQSYLSDYDVKPLTIGKIRPMSVSMRSEIQSTSVVLSDQELFSSGESPSSGYLPYPADEHLSWNVKDVCNDVQVVVGNHVDSLNSYSDSQSNLSNFSTNKYSSQESLPKQYLITNQITQIEDEDLTRNEYSHHNVTPLHNYSENRYSTDSNSAFYQKLSTIIHDWADRSFSYLIDSRLLRKSQDTEHVYEEVDSQSLYDNPYDRSIPKSHTYDSVVETTDLLNDQESAVFTEDPSENMDEDWYENYSNHSYASYLSKPSIPLSRAGIAHSYVPPPRTGVPTHLKDEAKDLTSVLIGRPCHLGRKSIRQRKRPNVLVPRVSAGMDSSDETYASGDGIRNIDSVMKEITAAMFQIRTFGPYEANWTHNNKIYSDCDSNGLSNAEYNSLHVFEKLRSTHLSTVSPSHSTTNPTFHFHRRNSTQKQMQIMHEMFTQVFKEARLEVKGNLDFENSNYCQSEPFPQDLDLEFMQHKIQMQNIMSLNALARNELQIGRERSKISESNTTKEVSILKCNNGYSKLNRMGCKSKTRVSFCDAPHSIITKRVSNEERKIDIPQIRTGPTNQYCNVYDSVEEASYDDATIAFCSDSANHDYDNVYTDPECQRDVATETPQSSYDHPDLPFSNEFEKMQKLQYPPCRKQEIELGKDYSKSSPATKKHARRTLFAGSSKLEQPNSHHNTTKNYHSLCVSIGHRNKENNRNNKSHVEKLNQNKHSSNQTMHRQNSSDAALVRQCKSINKDAINYDLKNKKDMSVIKPKTDSECDKDNIFFPIWSGGKWRKEKLSCSTTNFFNPLTAFAKNQNKSSHFQNSHPNLANGNKCKVDIKKQSKNKGDNYTSWTRLRKNALPSIIENATRQCDKRSLEVNRSVCASDITNHSYRALQKTEDKSHVQNIAEVFPKQKSLRGQFCLETEPKQWICSSRSLPSTRASFSSNNRDLLLDKSSLKNGSVDSPSTNLSLVTSWWEESTRESKQKDEGSDESMPPRLDSDEDEIRGRFDVKRLRAKEGISAKITSHAKAALLYLRGDGLLMSQYQPKSTTKTTQIVRKYGLNYPSLEDIHCFQTIKRLQSSSAETTLRSRSLRLTCKDSLCIYVRNVTSEIDLKTHLPVGNWPCRYGDSEVTVSLNETRELMERASKLYLCPAKESVDQTYQSALVEIPKPSGQQFQPFFPRLYKKHGLIPLAETIINSAIVGAKQIYRRNFAAHYQSHAERLGESLAERAFEIGIADYLINTAIKSSKIDLQAEHIFDAILNEPILDAIDEAVADEHKIIVPLKIAAETEAHIDSNSIINNPTFIQHSVPSRKKLACSRKCNFYDTVVLPRSKSTYIEKRKKPERVYGNRVIGEIHDVPRPSGLPCTNESCKSYSSYSSYSLYNPYDSSNDFMNNETEPTCTYSEESLTDYEYADKTKLIRKTGAKHKNFVSGVPNLCKNLDGTKKLQIRQKLKSKEGQNVMIGSRSSGKNIIRCESSQSLISSNSSFLNRRYRSLTNISHKTFKPTERESLYASTQTDKQPLTIVEKKKSQSSFANCKPVRDEAELPKLQSQQLQNSSSSTKQDSVVATSKKISNKESNQRRLEALHSKYCLPSVLNTSSFFQRNTRKLAPQTRSRVIQTTVVAIEPECELKQNKIPALIENTSEKSEFNQKNELSSPNLANDRVNTGNCVDEEKPFIDENTVTHEKAEDDESSRLPNSDHELDEEAKSSSLSRRSDIKKLLHELNEEMNGVREVVHCSKTDQCKVKPAVDKDALVPQISKGCDNCSSTEQLTSMLNELQLTLIDLVNEMTIKKLPGDQTTSHFTKNILGIANTAIHADEQQSLNPENGLSNSEHLFAGKDHHKSSSENVKKAALDVNTSDVCKHRSGDTTNIRQCIKLAKEDQASKLKVVTQRSDCSSNNCGHYDITDIKLPENIYPENMLNGPTRSSLIPRYKTALSNLLNKNHQKLFKIGLRLSRRQRFKKKNYFIENKDTSGNITLRRYKEDTASSSSSISVKTNSSLSYKNKSKLAPRKKNAQNAKAEKNLDIFPHPSCHPKRHRQLAITLGDTKRQKHLPKKAKKSSSLLAPTRERHAEVVDRSYSDCWSDILECKENDKLQATVKFKSTNSNKNKRRPLFPKKVRRQRFAFFEPSFSHDDTPAENNVISRSSSRSCSPKNKSVKFADEICSSNSKVEVGSSKKEKFTGSAHKHRNLKHVDYSIVNHNEACRHSHHTAHSRVNEPNDSVQLPVPELTDYFEDMSQLVGVRKNMPVRSDALTVDESRIENEICRDVSASGFPQQFFHDTETNIELDNNWDVLVAPSAGEKPKSRDKGSSPYPVTSRPSSCSDDLEQDDYSFPEQRYPQLHDNALCSKNSMSNRGELKPFANDRHYTKYLKKDEPGVPQKKNQRPTCYKPNENHHLMLRYPHATRRLIDSNDTAEFPEKMVSPKLNVSKKDNIHAEKVIARDSTRKIPSSNYQKYDFTSSDDNSFDIPHRSRPKQKLSRSYRLSRFRPATLQRSSSCSSFCGWNTNSKLKELRKKKLVSKHKMKKYFKKLMLRERNASRAQLLPSCDSELSRKQCLHRPCSHSKLCTTPPACRKILHQPRKHCLPNQPCCYHQKAEIHQASDLQHAISNQQYCDEKRKKIMADINFLRGLDNYEILDCHDIVENKSCLRGTTALSHGIPHDHLVSSQGHLRNDTFLHSPRHSPRHFRHFHNDDDDERQDKKAFNDAFYRNNPKASHLKSETNLNANSPSSNRMEDDDLMESELPTHCSPISKAKYAFSAAQSILDMLCRVIAGGALAYYFLRVDSSDIGDYAPI